MGKANSLQQVRSMLDDCDGVSFGNMGAHLDEITTVCDLALAERSDLVKALTRIRLWLAVEGCDEQREIADNALVAAGVTEVDCPHCEGVGEWDEGPLPATSRHQISPDYRHVACPDCNGSGETNLEPARAALSKAGA